MKTLVYTVAIGDFDYFKVTLPTIKAYAARICAHFFCATMVTVSPDKTHSPHHEKFGLVRALEGDFDRVCYIDADCLVRNDCPDLFDVVPEDSIGALNEVEFCPSLKMEFAAKIMRCQKFYGLTMVKPDLRIFGYYNTGVMVVSRRHKEYFVPPVRPYPFGCYDQDVINMRFRLQKEGEYIGFPKTIDLADRLNRMDFTGFMATCPREDAYIRHYAAISDAGRMVAMQKDLAEWRERGLA
jgi:hypothetical protein